MTMPTFTKSPVAVLDYAIDWSSWLASGETLVSSSWTVPPGITGASESYAAGKAIIWLSGGQIGYHATVTNQITTSDGRTDQRSFTIVLIDP